jgi:hypothetical protein
LTDLSPAQEFAASNLLPFEFSVLSVASKSLSRTDPRYLQVVQRDAGLLVFNPASEKDKPTSTRHITVSGVDLDLGPNGNAPLYMRLHDNYDIRELVICVDHLTITGALNLPGTKLSIWARKLTFVGNATISTQPRPFVGTSGLAQAMDGQAGGAVHLYVKEIEAPGSAKRFATQGAVGQAARRGTAGDKAKSVTPWDGIIRDTPTAWGGSETLSWKSEIAGNKKTDGFTPVIVNWWRIVYVEPQAGSSVHGWVKNTTNPDTIGSDWPTDGPAPKNMPGAPGLGGAGGPIYSNHISLIAAIAMQSRGQPGAMTEGIPENPAGTPVRSCKLEVGFRNYWPFPHFKAGVDGNGRLNMKDSSYFSVLEKRETKSHPPVPAPKSRADTADRDGKALKLATTAPWFWIHPLTLAALTAYARDAFRVGAPNVVRPLLRKYLDDMMGATEDVAPDFDILLARAELMDLAQRMDGPNDYFGHPAGWVPGLSFQTNMKAYERQIDGAVARLYLSYWMENNQAGKEQRIASARQAIGKLQAEVAQAVRDQGAAIAQMEQLADEESTLAARIGTFMTDLVTLEGELRRGAKGKAESEHAFRVAGRILGGVAQVIPVGQPVLGAIGKGFSALADWEGEGAVDAIKTVGKAVWDTALVSDKLLPKAKSTAANLLKAAGITSVPDKEPDDAEKDPAAGEFDKELKKTELSNKVKKHIQTQSDAKDQVISALGSLTISADELKTATEKALANCPEYKQLREKLEKLNADKTAYRDRIAAAAHALDAATTVIATSRLTQIALQSSVSQEAALLSPEGLRYTRAMGERAIERLQRFQYYFAASYVYANLSQPANFDGNSVAMFNELRDKLKTTGIAVLTGDDFDRLRVAFDENLAQVASDILTYHNETLPSRDQRTDKITTQVTIELSDHELAALNQGSNTVFIDPMAMGKLVLSQEDVRIYDLVVREIELVDPPARSVDVRVRIVHDGTSWLWRDGHQFQFRGAPTTWGATINSAPGSRPVAEARSTDDLSLILALTGQKSAAQLFPRPSAWAALRIRLELLDEVVEYRPKLKKLTLDLRYTARDTATKRRALFVSIADGIRPRIELSAADVSGRMVGEGTFLRTYAADTEVMLTAPERFGRHVFQGWRMQFLPGDYDPTRPVSLFKPGTAGYQGDMSGLVTGRSLKVTLDKNRFVRPIFILPAG